MAFRAEGKSISIVPLPMPLADLGLTAMGPLPFLPFGPDQARSLKMDNTLAENDVTAFGRDPGELRTLAEYLGLTRR
jgi:NADH dehydrogenase